MEVASILTTRSDVQSEPDSGAEILPRVANFLHGVLLATAVIGGVLMLAASASAQTACSSTINSCGCTIVKSGSYKIGLAITSTQDLTSTNTCITHAPT